MVSGWEGHGRECVVSGWEGHGREGVGHGREAKAWLMMGGATKI